MVLDHFEPIFTKSTLFYYILQWLFVQMVWALVTYLLVVRLLVYLVIHMLTCFLENLRMILLVGLLLLLPTWVSCLLSYALVDAGLFIGIIIVKLD